MVVATGNCRRSPVGARRAVGSLLDLLRPADTRTTWHASSNRSATKGWSGFLIVIHRKASLNFETFANTGWLLLLITGVGLLAWLWLRAAQPLRRLPWHAHGDASHRGESFDP